MARLAVPILKRLPIIGRKLKSFTKTRVFSIERIKSLGFRNPYSARVSLAKSAYYRLNF